MSSVLEIYRDSSEALAELNNELWSLQPPERLQCVAEKAGRMATLVSGGTQSVLTLSHLDEYDIPAAIVFLNTGFYPTQTYEYMDTQLAKYWEDRDFYEYGPSQETVHRIDREQLWKTNEKQYDWEIKGRHFEAAVNDPALGADVFVTGIHTDQTENRRGKQPLHIGRFGQLMLAPFIDWRTDQVYDYIEEHGLPTHPLYPEYTFVGDVNFMGAEKRECSIHVNQPEADQPALLISGFGWLPVKTPVGMQTQNDQEQQS